MRKLKSTTIVFFLLLKFNTVSSQVVQNEFNNIGWLVKTVFSNQKTIEYKYDKNGNRISQTTSNIITAVSNLNDSILQANNGVFIYPNPSNGNFKTRIYSTQKQKVTLHIYTVDGKLIHTYPVEVTKGYFDININISPKPSGTYVVTVIGKTLNASKSIIITN